MTKVSPSSDTTENMPEKHEKLEGELNAVNKTLIRPRILAQCYSSISRFLSQLFDIFKDLIYPTYFSAF
jgi:hypothetical protein